MSKFVKPQITDVHGTPRRRLLGLMAGGVLAPAAVWAQEATAFRIGVTKIVSHAALDADEKGFEAGLPSVTPRGKP